MVVFDEPVYNFPRSNRREAAKERDLFLVKSSQALRVGIVIIMILLCLK